MNTCDTCKWWSDEKTGSASYRYCHNDKLQDAQMMDYPEDGLEGGEPAECTVVVTGPKFGCIHHEPKC